ncbi:hypothetical protein [Allorhodopirellula solitaria]|uniref:DUF4292 domain-containing protein n=1 Tax=Allorhodopirellula solitaria TaxID=2527987 RepID=A0A5C5XPI6_9BACT|nr:hypothetical protein [Allorhodopirellula solitaria]TWT65126.1 hypothetical protein CA85_34730 [Allorhodopirellula solitaria]
MHDARTKTVLRSALALGLVLSGGCVRNATVANLPPPPVVLPAAPDINALAAAVNRTDAIRELSTNSATLDVLSMTAVPKLTATMHLQRERNFRLKASIPLIMGSGIDLGSNSKEFWFEVPEGMSQTLYYANHEQYSHNLQRAILPVDPSWLIEAIGLARLDPTTVIAGPVTRTDGLIEVRNSVSTAAGTYQRVCFIEPTAGYISHLFLYSPNGRLVAKSFSSEHEYFESVDSVLPHRVKIELFPSAGPPLAMQLHVPTYSINQLLSGDPQLFQMPATENRLDLLQMTGMPQATSYSPPPGTSAWAEPTTTAAGTPSQYTAAAPTGNPMRGVRYE